MKNTHKLSALALTLTAIALLGWRWQSVPTETDATAIVAANTQTSGTQQKTTLTPVSAALISPTSEQNVSPGAKQAKSGIADNAGKFDLTQEELKKLEGFCDDLLSHISSEKDLDKFQDRLKKESPAARDRLIQYLSAMLNSETDVVRRGAILFLLAQIQSQQVFANDLKDEKNCYESDDCMNKLRQLASARAQASVRALIQQATTSTEPELYAMAYKTCNHANLVPDQACQQISSRQWVRLDSDNAIAWLFLLLDQKKTPTPAAELNATLNQISRAGQFQPRMQTLQEIILTLLRQLDDTGMLLEVALLQVMTSSAQANSPYSLLYGICLKQIKTDASLKPVCSQIAQHLMDKDQNSLLAHMLAERISRTINGASPALDAYKKNLDVINAYSELKALQRIKTSAKGQSISKASMKQDCKLFVSDFYRDALNLSSGEVRVSQQQRLASGLTDEQILEQAKKLRTELSAQQK